MYKRKAVWYNKALALSIKARGKHMKYFKWRNTNWGAYTFAVCCGVILFVALENIGTLGNVFSGVFGFIKPVLFGVILAYIMDPLTQVFEEHVLMKVKKESARRTAAVAFTVVIVLAFLILFLVILVPQLITSIQEFSSNIDNYGHGLKSVFGDVHIKIGEFELDLDNLTDSINSAVTLITNYISQNMTTAIDLAKDIGGRLVAVVIAFIIAVYCLADKKNLLAGFSRLFKTLMSEHVFRNSFKIYDKTNTILSKYIVCTLIDALFVGVVNAFFMLICGMPYIALVSVVVGITNMAPTFGPIVGGIIGAFILLLANPWYALMFFIFTVVIQTIDGYIVKPKFYGNALSVPPIWIMIAIVVFGRMFGVIGIVLAIPFAAMIAYLLKEILNFLDFRKMKTAEIMEMKTSGNEDSSSNPAGEEDGKA